MLFNHCLLFFPFCVGSLFCAVVLGFFSSLAIILLRMTELVTLIYVVTVCVLCLFLMMQCVGLLFVIVHILTFSSTHKF